MQYSYFEWGVSVLWLVSAILNFHMFENGRKLNQRFERLIEQEEESYKCMVRNIEELEQFVARKKQEDAAT